MHPLLNQDELVEDSEICELLRLSARKVIGDCELNSQETKPARVLAEL